MRLRDNNWWCSQLLLNDLSKHAARAVDFIYFFGVDIRSVETRGLRERHSYQDTPQHTKYISRRSSRGITHYLTTVFIWRPIQDSYWSLSQFSIENNTIHLHATHSPPTTTNPAYPQTSQKDDHQTVLPKNLLWKIRSIRPGKLPFPTKSPND